MIKAAEKDFTMWRSKYSHGDIGKIAQSGYTRHKVRNALRYGFGTPELFDVIKNYYSNVL